MTTYWYVDGMAHPYWACYPQLDYPQPGDTTYFWHNSDADTDMGDLYGDEFQQMFPWARQISKREFDEQA
jgi:hypothetical protein